MCGQVQTISRTNHVLNYITASTKRNSSYKNEYTGTQWINTRIKNLINYKTILYDKYFCSGKNKKLFEGFKPLQNKIVNLKNDSKDLYITRISNKLNDSHVFPKVYLLILKRFLNNKKKLILRKILFHKIS